MSARADFKVLVFNEHLGDNQSEIDTDFTVMGQVSSQKIFEVNQQPFDAGFVQYLVSHGRADPPGGAYRRH